MSDFWTSEELTELVSGFDEATWGGNTIYGVFSNGYYPSSLQEGIVETSSPQFTCKASDVSGAVHGSTITINSVAYKITGIEPDGAGLTTLILSRD